MDPTTFDEYCNQCKQNRMFRWLDCEDCRDKRREGKDAECIYVCVECGVTEPNTI